MLRPDRSSLWVVLLATVVTAIALSSCRFLEQVAPTVVPPRQRSQPAESPSTIDESPRLRSAQDVPPTWTPPPAIRSEAPIAPAEGITPQAGSQGSYTVQTGDTLADIAIRFNVTMEALAAANSIEDFDHIEVGQVLVIP